MSPSHRPSLRSMLTAGGVAMAMAGILVGPAFATGSTTGPTYVAAISPMNLAAGTATSSTISLTQLVDQSHGRELGSVRITPPAGFILTGATAARGSRVLPVTIAAGSATIDNVDLDDAGQTASVALQATIPCGISGAATWTVVAHSTYSYDNSRALTLIQDPSSQLTAQVTRCRLAFATQPAAAGAGKVVSSQPANPAGTPIQVQLLDGNGVPESQAGLTVGLTIEPGTGSAGALLGGTTAVATDGNGLAAFGPTVDRAGHAYRLHAEAGTGVAPAISAAFDVSDVATVCAGACSGSAQLGDTSATVSANSNGGVLSLSVGLDDVDCNNAVNHFYLGTSQAVTFDVTPAIGRTTVTMKLAAASVTRPFYRYEVCFSSPNSTFVNKYGVTIPAGQAGILPWCFNCTRPSGGPCVLFKWFDRYGNVFVKFSVPSGDPRGKI